MATFGTKQNKPRTCFSSFNEAQDVLLCSAWSKTMTDPKVAIGQNPAFWVKVHKYWLRHKRENYPKRTPIELMQRFSLIKTAIDKFAGHFAQVGYFSNQMGIDKVTLAKRMYSELEEMKNLGKKGNRKPTFDFEHCWNVLKYEQLWIRVFSAELKEPKHTVNSSVHDIIQRGVCDVSSKLVAAESPVDGKLAKEGGRKRKGNFKYDSTVVNRRIDQSHDSTQLCKRIDRSHDSTPLHKQEENASGDDHGKGKKPIERKAANVVQAPPKGDSQNPIVVD